MFDIRALNHSRREYLPTYIGMRMLLEAPGSEAKHIEGIVRSRLLTEQRQSYSRYRIYKATDDTGKNEYRHASAASPLALLGESYVLDIMSRDSAFSNLRSTYSYEWPSQKSTQMWQYYYKGFQRRSEIVRAQIAGSDKLVLVMDIKKFYPNINSEMCLKVLGKAISSSSLNPQQRRMVSYAAEAALISVDGGLPIGPPISHALGNVFLREFDEQMNKEFGVYYHRYVDDIAIVISLDQVKKATKIVSDHLKRLGLSLNRGKTHVVSATEWDVLSEARPASENFGELRDKITAYLAVRPYKERFELRSALKDAGFNLPISQFAYSARSVGYISFLTNAIRYGSFKSLFSSQKDIIKFASKARENLSAEVRAIILQLERSTPYTAGVLRKRLVNLIGLLLYMYPISDLEVNVRDVPNTSDATNLRALLKALITGDATNVLPFPGSTANTFAQIWSESGRGLAHLDLSLSLDEAQRDAIFALSLYNVVRIDEVDANLKGRADQELLRVCMGKKSERRVFNDLSYADEVQSLFLGARTLSPSQFLFDRKDNDQEVGVEGLDLATDYD